MLRNEATLSQPGHAVERSSNEATSEDVLR